MSAYLVKGVFGHSSTFYAIRIKKPSKFEIFDMLLYVFMPNSFNTVTQFMTHISYETRSIVLCMLTWQPLLHKDCPHFINGIRGL